MILYIFNSGGFKFASNFYKKYEFLPQNPIDKYTSKK